MTISFVLTVNLRETARTAVVLHRVQLGRAGKRLRHRRADAQPGGEERYSFDRCLRLQRVDLRREPSVGLCLRVALHIGSAIYGNIGAADRLDFTAIGPAVNLVSRLEGLCRPLGKTVLVSGALAAETDAPLIALGTHELRGIASPCAVFTLPD